MDFVSNERGEYCPTCDEGKCFLSAIYGRSKILKGENLENLTVLFKTLGVTATFDGEDKTPKAEVV